MIPSDHFVRYYNEVFKAVDEAGRDKLTGYWRALGENQKEKLGEKFRAGGIRACYEYWTVIKKEENCDAKLSLTEDYFEFLMEKCPSLSKVLDNDAEPFELYCDHCMGWIGPVMEYAGLFPAADIISRSEPVCRFRVYKDKDKAREYACGAAILSRPYEDHSGTKKQTRTD